MSGEPAARSRRQTLESAGDALEARLAAIFEAALDPIVTIDSRGIIDSVNPACEELLGYPPVELIGENVSCLVSGRDAERHDEYIARYLRTGERTIIGIGREVLARHRDGRLIPVHLAISEFTFEGKRYFTGILRDLRARVEAEDALNVQRTRNRELSQLVDAVIVVLDGDGRVVEWNRAAERAFGLSAGEAVGRTFTETVLSPAAGRRFGEAMERCLDGHRLSDFEIVLPGSDGPMTLLWNVSLLDEGDGRCAWIVCAQDVTEYRKLVAQISEERSLRNLGELAAVVAHEVRNPLAGISGALQIVIKDKGIGDGSREVIGEILERLDSLNATVSDLLVYARPKTPSCARVPLSLLLDDLVLIVRQDPAFSGVEIAVEGPSLDVVCDANMLKPVILNLLLNAAQAMGGEGRIRISVEEARERIARIVVDDDGPGIPEETRATIFEPFFTTKARGTGLGLPIARRIAEQHCGDLRVTEGPLGGARFVLDLPLDGPDAQRARVEASRTRGRVEGR